MAIKVLEQQLPLLNSGQGKELFGLQNLESNCHVTATKLANENCKDPDAVAFFERLAQQANACVEKRTWSGYKSACDYLLLAKKTAEMTGDPVAISQMLADFKQRHQTKSMLISMISRLVQ